MNLTSLKNGINVETTIVQAVHYFWYFVFCIFAECAELEMFRFEFICRLYALIFYCDMKNRKRKKIGINLKIAINRLCVIACTSLHDFDLHLFRFFYSSISVNVPFPYAVPSEHAKRMEPNRSNSNSTWMVDLENWILDFR